MCVSDPRHTLTYPLRLHRTSTTRGFVAPDRRCWLAPTRSLQAQQNVYIRSVEDTINSFSLACQLVPLHCILFICLQCAWLLMRHRLGPAVRIGSTRQKGTAVLAGGSAFPRATKVMSQYKSPIKGAIALSERDKKRSVT